jgi:tRNA uridine 5-carboxymethylaminomethyl modification enzyme
MEDKRIPAAFDFSTVPSLRLEASQKLTRIRPVTIGQAARISGVSPADIGILLVWLKRNSIANGKNDSSSDLCVKGFCEPDLER